MEGRLWFRFSDQSKVPEPDHYLFCFDISFLPQLYSLSLLFVSGQNNSFASLHSPRLMMIDMNTRESNEISRTDKKERNENREQGIQAEEQPSEESYTAREKILLEPYTFSHHIYSFLRKKRSSHLHGWLPFFLLLPLILIHPHHETKNLLFSIFLFTLIASQADAVDDCKVDNRNERDSKRDFLSFSASHASTSLSSLCFARLNPSWQLYSLLYFHCSLAWKSKETVLFRNNYYVQQQHPFYCFYLTSKSIKQWL